MDECSSIPIELFTKTGGKATGHSPHCTQRVLKSLCAETWPIRGGKKTKQYFFFVFVFVFCLKGLLKILEIFLTELLKETKKKESFCVFFIGAHLSGFCLTECFVSVFVLGLKAENSQYSMALSSGELENT